MITASTQPHLTPFHFSSVPESLPAPAFFSPLDDFQAGYVPFLEQKVELQEAQIDILKTGVARLKALLRKQRRDARNEIVRQKALLRERKDDFEELLVNAHYHNGALNVTWRLCITYLWDSGLLGPFRWWLRKRAISRGLKNLRSEERRVGKECPV